MLRLTTTRQLNSLRASRTSLTHTDEGIHRALQFINTLEVDAVEVPQIEQTASESVRQLLAALVNMREQMRQIAEQEKQRNWVSEGLAQFVEILRSHPSDMDSLYDTILATLVKYLGANQGGLFVAQTDPESGTTLQLVACYAYDRRKHLQKTVAVGEGLLGQCYLEQNLIYLTDLPTDYLAITSGLGQACPRVILLVPLKLNDQVLGVLELASFNPLEPHQIEFVTRLGESIAATISNVSTSAHTRQLLETAQQQSERLLTQEEEMRQNLEELSATQEQMRRREAETQNILLALEAVNDTFATVELTMQGAVLNANANFLTLMGYTSEEIRGCHHRQFVDTAHAQSAEYAQFWENLNEGRLFSGEAMRLTKSGQPVWMRVSYAPVRNSEGLYYKVMVLAQDVTEARQAAESAQRLSLVTNNTGNAVVITNANGLIEYVNNGFEQMTGYTLAEVAGRQPGSFLQGPDTDPATIQRIRQKIAAQAPFYEEILNYGKSGETYWISLAINPVWDESGKLHKFIAIH